MEHDDDLNPFERADSTTTWRDADAVNEPKQAADPEWNAAEPIADAPPSEPLNAARVSDDIEPGVEKPVEREPGPPPQNPPLGNDASHFGTPLGINPEAPPKFKNPVDDPDINPDLDLQETP